MSHVPLMSPSRHVRKIFGWSSPPRLEGIASWTPPPLVGNVLGQPALYQLNNVLTNVGEDLEGVSALVSELWSMRAERRLTRCPQWLG